MEKGTHDGDGIRGIRRWRAGGYTHRFGWWTVGEGEVVFKEHVGIRSYGPSLWTGMNREGSGGVGRFE